jgi:hypothetical protein
VIESQFALVREEHALERVWYIEEEYAPEVYCRAGMLIMRYGVRHRDGTRFISLGRSEPVSLKGLTIGEIRD